MADTVVGLRLQTQGGDQVQNTVGNIKKELRSAQQEAVALSAKFGETSQEALDAAKRVAQLRDQIQDTNERVALFDPGARFAAFGNVLRTVAGGFSALTGSLALFGVQSEEVEKTLLKVQAALAITEGVNTIVDAGKDFQRLQAIISQTTIVQKAFAASTLLTSNAFKALGISVTTTSTAFRVLRTAIITTGIGALVVGVGLLIEKMSSLSGATRDAADAQREFNSELEASNKAGLQAGLAFIERQKQLEIAQARAEGATQQRLQAIEEKYYQQRLAAYQRYKQDQLADGLSTAEADEAIQAESEKREIDRLNRIADARNKQRQTERTQIKEEQAKDLNDALDKEMEGLDKLKNLRVNGGEAGKSLAEQRKEERDAELAAAAAFEQQRVALVTDAQNTINAVTATGKRSQEEYRNSLIAREQAEMSLYTTSVQAIGALADLVGRQTAAGKVLALAEIAAGTAVGFIQGLDIAQKAAKATGPAAAFAFPIFYASQIAAVLGAASRARAVLNSGASGGGAGVSSPALGRVTAPTFQRQQASVTTLDQRSINAIGDATARVFVLESDVTTGQERRKRLNRAARLG